MKTGRKLLSYALIYKKIVIAALVMLTISVAADLTGPFIAKKVIDEHILGIESIWYETGKGNMAVNYDGHYYKRATYFDSHEARGRKARVLQVGKDFVLIHRDLSFDGKRSLKDGVLTVQNGRKVYTYKASVISSSDLIAFSQPEIPKIIQLLGVYFGLLVVSSAFQYFQRLLLQTSANRIIQKMREDIFGHIQKLPIRFFDNLPAGKVVARITNDTEAIRELYVTVLSTFFTSAINIAGIFIALFILNPVLAAVCLVLLPILYVWIIFYRKYASKYNHVIRSRVSDINGMVNESIQGMNIIQAFGREKETQAEFEKLNSDHFSYQNKLLSLNSMTSHNLVGVLRNLTFMAFISYFGFQSLLPGVAISLGMLYAFVDYINRLFEPIQGIVNQLANLESALVAGERVFELLNEPGEDVSIEQIPRYNGNVSFKKVSFGYKEDDYVLK
ncbi:MAG: ABC transporter ATP-binding protein, partial [Bacillota bacterium]|nr:ABC transporter ATP-binding protein [Bacillota bacterium]